MLNVNLSYKPPSYWRIPFRSRGRTRQFSRLKKFRAIVVPVGGCCKGIILQGRQLPSGLLVICQSRLRRKRDVMGASVHVPRQRNSTYIKTFRQSNIRDQVTRTPSLAKPTIQTMTPGTPFTYLLQGGGRVKSRILFMI